MLLKYELKKLLTNRMNLVAMVIGTIILGLTTIYPVMSESEYIMETDESLKGIEATEYNQKKAESQTEYLTDEYVNPQYHGNTIGRTLVAMMKEHYKDYLRVAVIAYDNELHFYEQCGFAKSNDASPMFITSLWT